MLYGQCHIDQNLPQFTTRSSQSTLLAHHCFHLVRQVIATTKHIESLPVAKSVNLHLLKYSADEVRKYQQSASGRSYDKVVVGAAIFRRVSKSISSKKTPSILLLQRSAHETYLPNVFELPSGKVDQRDLTLEHALTREVKEETGLNVIGILAELNSMIYTTEKPGVDDAGGEFLFLRALFSSITWYWLLMVRSI